MAMIHEDVRDDCSRGCQVNEFVLLSRLKRGSSFLLRRTSLAKVRLQEVSHSRVSVVGKCQDNLRMTAVRQLRSPEIVLFVEQRGCGAGTSEMCIDPSIRSQRLPRRDYYRTLNPRKGNEHSPCNAISPVVRARLPRLHVPCSRYKQGPPHLCIMSRSSWMGCQHLSISLCIVSIRLQKLKFCNGTCDTLLCTSCGQSIPSFPPPSPDSR